MKLTNTHHLKRGSGMTLLELTVVILVLLSLISILFIGARAWKKGSDRSANIMNIRNCQQAMRGHENMRTDQADMTFTTLELAQYIKMPTPPALELTYTPGETITPTGTLWLTVTYGAGYTEFEPSASLTADW